jgi:hypothetical protein
VDETIVSWMRQSGRDENLEVVIAVARQAIIREYEELIESLGAHAGVLLSSTLATLPLLENRGATLLVRLCGRMMTTVIVNGPRLCVSRGTEMHAEAGQIEPGAVLEEIFPAVAYYQDSWGSPVDRARLSGFGDREGQFAQALAAELKIPVAPISESAPASTLQGPARDLVPHGLDALAGWMLNNDV